MSKKMWYQSKTIWANVLGLAVLIIPQLIDALTQTFPQADLITVWGGFALAVVNIVLRFVTSEPLKF